MEVGSDDDFLRLQVLHDGQRRVVRLAWGVDAEVAFLKKSERKRRKGRKRKRQTDRDRERESVCVCVCVCVCARARVRLCGLVGG